MFNPFKQKEYIYNKPERKTLETFEDAYTKAERIRKSKANSGETENTDSIFIDKAGRKIPVNQLNGDAEYLLKRDIAKAQKEWAENNFARQEEDINDNIALGGKLNKKLYPDYTNDWHDAPGEDNSENLKTNSPARRHHDIRQTRKELDKIDNQEN